MSSKYGKNTRLRLWKVLLNGQFILAVSFTPCENSRSTSRSPLLSLENIGNPRRIYMSALSRDEFVAFLKKSRAIDDEAIDSWMSRVDDQEPKKIASKLVRDKMLTQWQAKMLLAGRSRLTVGNYRLLSRINRNELGDRFEAIHSQLGRKVVIQIFPSSIAKDEELRARVLKAMQKMTELDHTALVHVYDVDQERDRYFVVTEFIDGTALSELPRGDLKDSGLASVVADLIAGVTYAHQQGVIHGNILQENVLMTAQNRGKLQGLPTSAVRWEMSGSSGDLSHQQDFAAISKLGCSVLQEVPPRRRGEGYDALVEIVGELASTEDSDLEKMQLKLAQWLAEHGSKMPEANRGANDTGDLALAQPVDPLAAQQSGGDTSSAMLPKNKEKADTESEAESVGFLTKMWNEKRALSLAAIAAAVFALVGGVGTTGYLLTQPSFGGSGNTVANKDRTGLKPASLDTSAAEKSDAATVSKRPKEFKLENLAAGTGLLSAARPKDALEPEATKRKFEEMYAKRNAAVDQPPAAEVAAEAKAARIKAKRKERKRKAREAAAEAMKASKPVPENPQDTQTETSAKTSEKTAEAAETATAKSAEKKTSSAKGNPFAKLPETVDLPPSTETGDVKIANVTIDKRYLMGLELLAGPEICKHKFVFDLKRSASDKQLWDIRMQRRKRDDPLPVAQIQKTPAELKFRWLSAAEKFEDANYIRNCKIKLSAAEYSAWIGLRKPVDIQNFAFQSGKTSVKADIDLAWLPNPQKVQIELAPIKVEEKDKENREKGKVFYSPREVSKKAPGLIYFREKEDLRFFFVEVSVDVRSKLKMQAQMYTLGGDGSPRPLKREADFTQLFDVLTARKAEAELLQATIESAKNKAGVVKIMPNLSEEGDFRAILSKAKKTTSLATRQQQACEDYVQIIKKLVGLKIPFQVFFDMDGHRIKLAQSTAK